VGALRKKFPLAYKGHWKTKLLARVHHAVTVDVPENPGAAKFFLAT
jgi:hypothetical protein